MILRKLIYLCLLLLFSCAGLPAQEIVGGPTSPDLKNIPPYPLINLVFKTPNDANGKPYPIVSISWLSLSIINNNIISHAGYTCGNDYIFTGPPGSYMVLCSVNYNNKNSHATVNLTIPSGPYIPPGPGPGPGPPKPGPDPNPVPNPPVPVDPKPVPINIKVFAAMVADTSSSLYPNSNASNHWTSQTIVPTLNNINVTWKHYDINSKVNDGKGNLIPLSQSSWGKEALKHINANNIASLVLVDNKGIVIDSLVLPASEQETINYIKTKLGR